MKIERCNKISKLVNGKQSVLILGPRGSGKSYYIRSLLKSLKIKSIEIDLLLNQNLIRYKNNPSILYSEISKQISILDQLIVFIDEIQRLPEILNEVHKLIEEYKPRLQFILTGSSARKLKRSGSNLLAGRAILVDFFPFTHQEVNFNQNLFEILRWGTMPELYLETDAEIKTLRLDSYVKTYLAEEIRLESEIRNIEGFNRFLDVVAQLNSTPVNMSKIAKAANISQGSVSSYFDILVETLIVYRIPGWTNSIVKQLTAANKYYFFDNGVLNYLQGYTSIPIQPSSNRFGSLFENLVVCEIIRYSRLNNIQLNIFHYRTNSGQEIDLILQKHAFARPVAIEIKSILNPEMKGKYSALESFKSENPTAELFVISRNELSFRQGDITFVNFINGLEEIFHKVLDE